MLSTGQSEVPLAPTTLVRGSAFDTYAEAFESAQTRFSEDGFTIVEASRSTIAGLMSVGVPAPAGGWERYTAVFELAEDLAHSGHNPLSPDEVMPWYSRILGPLIGVRDAGSGAGYDPWPAVQAVLQDLRQDSTADALHLRVRVDRLLEPLGFRHSPAPT
jgi:hypothetical protein